MTLLVHVGRAALIFFVAAVLLPQGVVRAGHVDQHSSSRAALHGLADTAAVGRDGIAGVTAGVHDADDDVLRLVARVGLEVERFIAKIP